MDIGAMRHARRARAAAKPRSGCLIRPYHLREVALPSPFSAGSSGSATGLVARTVRLMWLEQFLQDLRYAWRAMRQDPAFVATPVLTLAAGLGMLTIAFTIFNAYVL